MSDNLSSRINSDVSYTKQLFCQRIAEQITTRSSVVKHMLIICKALGTKMIPLFFKLAGKLIQFKNGMACVTAELEAIFSLIILATPRFKTGRHGHCFTRYTFFCHITVKPRFTITRLMRSLDTTFSLHKLPISFIRTVYTTVEPVLSGTLLSGHPLLSGQLSKSRKLFPLITVILTFIKRSPLLRGRGHPKLGPNELFLLS